MIQCNLSEHYLIEASAGTGKTYNLERLILDFIVNEGLPLSKILVVTYTEKAARELRERIRTKLLSALGEQPENLALQRALSDFDNASIHTIHGFCSRVLKEFPVEGGFAEDRELERDDAVLKEFLLDYFRGQSEQLDPNDYCFFIHDCNGFSRGVKKIISLYKKNLSEAKVFPTTDQIAAARQFATQYQTGTGSLIAALKQLHKVSDLNEIRLFLIEQKLDHFNKSSIKPKKIQEAFQSLGSLLRAENFYQIITTLSREASSLEKLSSTYLQDKLKKSSAQIPLSELLSPYGSFFEAVAALLAVWVGFCDQQDLEIPLYIKTMSFAFIQDVLGYLDRGLPARKQTRKVYDFDDLIHTVQHLASTNSPWLTAIRDKYTVALIDEFQDTDAAQWQIFQTIFKPPTRSLVLVGDPKQSIYKFRGADLEVYYAAKTCIEEKNLMVLDTNYRSSKKMIAGLNFLSAALFDYYSGQGSQVHFSPAKFPEANGESASGSLGQVPIEFLLIGLEEQEKPQIDVFKMKIYQAIVGEIKKMTAKGSTPDQMAVLTATNRECEEIYAVLLQQGIPALIVKHPELFQSREAQEMLWILDAICFWSDSGKISQALLTSFFDQRFSDIVALRQSSAFASLQEEFRKLKALLDNGKLILVFEKILNQPQSFFQTGGPSQNYNERYLRLLNGERRITNVRHILERLHSEQRRRRLDAMGLYDLLVDLINGTGSSKDEDLMRLDRDQSSVQIMSMHTAKGLQFNTVFIAGGFSEGPHPDYFEFYDRSQSKTFDFLSLSEHRPAHDKAVWEEKKRLLYVAFTRARTRLFLPFLMRKPGKAIMDNFYLSLLAPRLQDQLNLSGHPLDLCFDGDSRLKAGLTPDILLAELQAICGENADLFSVIDPVKESCAEVQSTEANPVALVCSELANTQGFAARRRYLASFTSLTSNVYAESLHQALLRDTDNGVEELPVIATPQPGEGVQRLPGGARFGDMVHNLLEQLPFHLFSRFATPEACLSDRYLSDRMLAIMMKHYDSTWCNLYLKGVIELIWHTLNTPLKLADQTVFKLSSLKPEQKKHELEFTLAVSGSAENKIQLLEKIKLRKIGPGYLKGFIDLVFIHENKYYLLDWKTNYLGPTFADYHPLALESKMQEHQYHAQYYIYLTALLTYWRSVDPNFDYARDFGGCLYLFVRGLDANQHTEPFGVYLDKPDLATVESFIRQFNQGARP